MRKSAALMLASAFVAVTASAASAAGTPRYPGDHPYDYDPINQAYEWQLNNDGGSTAKQFGYTAFAAAKHRRPIVSAPSEDSDPWTKARTDDAAEQGEG